MHPAVFILTAETWVKHGRWSNIYSEQLSYAVFASVSEDVHLPENIIEAIVESYDRADVDFVDGFSIVTDRHKVTFPH